MELKPPLSPRGPELWICTSTADLIRSVLVEHPHVWVLLQLKRGFSNCGLCGHGPCQSLGYLYSTHSNPRRTDTAALDPDLSGPALVPKCKQCLKDTRANCQYSHDQGGVKNSANNRVLCEPKVLWKKWHNRAHSQVNSTNRGIHSGSSPSESDVIPPTSHCISGM